MATPFIGEIRLFAGNFAPAGWAFCDGQLLPISENETLFNLIGTTYGGNGQSTFALPDLRGRVPIHFGPGIGLSNRIIGETGGVEQVTLTTPQIPAHNHPLQATSALATVPGPGGAVPAQSRQAGIDLYLEDDPSVSMAPTSIGAVGGSQPHENMQPYLGMNYIISLFGIFPSPT
ncbi:MAG: tail fiber protein [Wenzhouxiangellaceae bacterium]|nr:tail fiber protein [Wenzhouxiangellaceae bacterium]